MAHKPLMLDLFSGAGGMSMGLKRAGFQAIGAFEWNAEAAATYKANLSEDLLVSGFGPTEGDISTLSPNRLARDLVSLGLKMGSRVSPGDIDLIAAGPPCQGFSRVGRGKLNNLAGVVDSFRHDPRNQLYLRALEIVQAVMPKAVLLENVPGLLHLSGINMAEVISKALEDLGYQVRYTILNAAWYGVPQTRERVFILGFHNGLVIPGGPTFPAIRHDVGAPKGGLTSSDLSNEDWKYYVPLSMLGKEIGRLPGPITAEQALSDLPPFRKHLEYVDKWGYTLLPGYRSLRELHPPVSYLAGRPNSYQHLMRTWVQTENPRPVSDHFCRWVPRDFWTFKEMESGHNYLDALKVAQTRFDRATLAWKRGKLKREPQRNEFIPPYNPDNFHEKWRKLHRDRPSWTLTAHLGKDTYSHIHYDSTQARAISPREAARLQSFPDGYLFTGSSGDMFRQIGNAVPPLLASALGTCILDQLQIGSATPVMRSGLNRITNKRKLHRTYGKPRRLSVIS